MSIATVRGKIRQVTDRPASSRREALLRLVEAEAKEPLPYESFLERLPTVHPDDPALVRLLRAKDRQHRHAYYVKSERLWYRRFGFRIMRPLFVVAFLAAIAFSFQRALDPTLAFACFAGGAAALYLTIQVFSMRWMRQDEAKLAEVETTYRRELEALRDELARS